MNDAAAVSRLCDWSEHPLQIGNDSQKQWSVEARAKTRRLDRYQGNDTTRGTPKRPGGFSRFGQANFQPYESPNLLHGCTWLP